VGRRLGDLERQLDESVERKEELGMEGTLHEQDGRYVLRFERRLSHPAEEVWHAITEPGRLKEWFPADIEGERVAGGKIRFVMRGGEDGGDGEITAFDPLRLFEYTWGDEILCWEVPPGEAGDGRCVLVFTDTFDRRDRAAPFAGAWHASLDALEASLRGRPAAWSAALSRADELTEVYAKSFA
jgi:uncharacterized protein YndB with AHSA1/START domain